MNLQAPARGALDVERVRRAVADVPGVRVVAIKAELDAIYARFLHAAEWQAGLGALAVSLLLAARLRSARRLLAVVLPIAAATLVVLAALALAGVALGILHLVGLLLTVAIGSNYALFFDHLRERPSAEADTLASLLLATLTTFASFALLASSRIPVLQAVGVVVAPGALLCLVFSAAWLGRGAAAAAEGHGKIAAVNTRSDLARPAAAARRSAARRPRYVTASVACTPAPALPRSRCPTRGPGRSARSPRTTSRSPPAGSGRARTGSAATGRACPRRRSARREIALTIDDGPDPAVTPAVLDLLDLHGARATFFCIAERARAHPALCREIVRRGHSVQNHSDRHSHAFSLLGPGAIAREIAAAQATLADVTGVVPRFFRAPAGLRNPFLAPVLQRLDLQLVSWTRRGYDTVRREPEACSRGSPAARGRRHPARSRRQRSAAARTAGPCCSRCCRSCSAARRERALVTVTLPALPPTARQREDDDRRRRVERPGARWCRRRARPTGAPDASPGTSRAASCASIRSSAT